MVRLHDLRRRRGHGAPLSLWPGMPPRQPRVTSSWCCLGRYLPKAPTSCVLSWLRASFRRAHVVHSSPPIRIRMHFIPAPTWSSWWSYYLLLIQYINQQRNPTERRRTWPVLCLDAITSSSLCSIGRALALVLRSIARPRSHPL